MNVRQFTLKQNPKIYCENSSSVALAVFWATNLFFPISAQNFVCDLFNLFFRSSIIISVLFCFVYGFSALQSHLLINKWFHLQKVHEVETIKQIGQTKNSVRLLIVCFNVRLIGELNAYNFTHYDVNGDDIQQRHKKRASIKTKHI